MQGACGSHCCCWCWWCTVGAALPQHPTCLLGGTQCITHTQKRCQAVTVTPQKPGLLYWAASCTKATHPSFPASRYFPTILIVLLAVFNDGAMIALSKVRLDCMRSSIDRDKPVGETGWQHQKAAQTQHVMPVSHVTYTHTYAHHDGPTACLPTSHTASYGVQTALLLSHAVLSYTPRNWPPSPPEPPPPSQDNVTPSPTPNSWRLRDIFAVGIIYGLYLTLSSWVLFHVSRRRGAVVVLCMWSTQIGLSGSSTMCVIYARRTLRGGLHTTT